MNIVYNVKRLFSHHSGPNVVWRKEGGEGKWTFSLMRENARFRTPLVFHEGELWNYSPISWIMALASQRSPGNIGSELANANEAPSTTEGSHIKPSPRLSIFMIPNNNKAKLEQEPCHAWENNECVWSEVMQWAILVRRCTRLCARFLPLSGSFCELVVSWSCLECGKCRRFSLPPHCLDSAELFQAIKDSSQVPSLKYVGWWRKWVPLRSWALQTIITG